MKISELREILDQSKYGKAPCYKDEEISIALADPSMGSRAMASIESAYFGFDWENGHLILIPKQPLTKKTYKEAMLDAAYDLIYSLSKQLTPKGNPTTLAKRAQSILDRAKSKIE